MNVTLTREQRRHWQANSSIRLCQEGDQWLELCVPTGMEREVIEARVSEANHGTWKIVDLLPNGESGTVPCDTNPWRRHVILRRTDT